MLKSKIYSYCLILSTVILGVNATSVAAQNIKQTQEIEAKNFLTSAIKTEQGYYFELNKFTSNLSDLQLTPPNDSYQYNVNIISDQKLVQAIASPAKLKGLRTFTAALSFDNENYSFNSILCKSEKSTRVIASEIKLVAGQLHCPTGFTISFHDAQKEALGSIEATNRAQQAYMFETQSFTVNQRELGYSPSNTYFDYKLNLLENDQLVQAIATPKFDNLKSYIGGVFYEKNTGVFKSIACASKQPTKNIPQSIKLSNGKLVCPTGFKITALNLPQDAINNVQTINRAQQAYFMETQNFSENTDLLGFTPVNDFFDYVIDILENGKLAQTIATPKSNNLKSYIGGVFIDQNTGTFQSIICTSEQLTKNIPQSIKLSNGKLACPTGFKVVAKS